MKKIIVYLISALLVLSSRAMPVAFADGNTIYVNMLQNENTLEIEGGGCGSTVKTVGIRIENPNGEKINLNQLTVEEDGTFSYTVTLDETALTGTYTVYAAERGRKTSGTAYYLSAAEIDDIEETVRQQWINYKNPLYEGNPISELTSYLYSKREMLGINSYGYDKCKNAAQILINVNDTKTLAFDEIASLCAGSDELYSGLHSITTVSQTTLKGVLAEHNAELLGDCDEYRTYSGFMKDDREAVDIRVIEGKNYTDIFDFRAKFIAAVKAVEATIKVRMVSAEATVEGDAIVIKGESGLSFIRAVTLRVSDPDGTPINVNQIKTETDGSFSYTLTMPTDASQGHYTVEVFGRGANKKTSCRVFLLSSSKKAEIAAAVYNAESIDATEAVLKTYKEDMQMTNMTADERRNAALYLFEQKTEVPYDYDNDVLSGIDAGIALCSELNLRDWTDADAYFAANSTALFDKNCGYSAYSGKTEIKRNEICREIMKSAPFATIEAFRKVFKTKASASSGGGGGGGGGGAGGSGGSGSAGGGGGGFAISYPTVENPGNDTPTGSANQSPFNDLGSYKWAEESVLTLYKAGVVSPASDKKFRPADFVSREEFIKLLMCAFEIPTDEKESGFSDVDASAWYSPYVTAAAAKGIVNGYEDGSFGIGQKISRQDMAVMVSRCIKVCGVSLPETNEEMSFKDEAKISDYAKEAVRQLQMSGILNGDETGSFNANKNANRAEAAKVIAMLIKAL